MTALGADQAYSSGTFYKERYLGTESSLRIDGVSPEVSVPSQLRVTSPSDSVLHGSAMAFVQGLYPPWNATQTLADGTIVVAPLDGYQYVPVYGLNSPTLSTSSESKHWLQQESGCPRAVNSSAGFFQTDEFKNLTTHTEEFYQRLYPVVKPNFLRDELHFLNSYLSKFSSPVKSRFSPLFFLLLTLWPSI